MEVTPSNLNGEFADKRIDHQSGWSRAKIIQNKVIDLRPHASTTNHFCPFRPTSSSFDKKRSYFDIDLFNDAALHELQKSNQPDVKGFTNFRCVALEVTHEGILIATNDNFVLFGRKTMRCESFIKIRVGSLNNMDRIVIDALQACSLNGNDVVLAILRDGTVRSFRFDRPTPKSIPFNDCGGEPSISSVFSLQPIPPASADRVSASSSVSAQSTGAFAISHDVGKSCTIQSIVQCERRIYDELHTSSILDMNEYKTLMDEEDSVRNSLNQTRFQNDQIVVSSSFDCFARRRQQMVQLLGSTRLVMLHHGRLRSFNFQSNQICHMDTNSELGLLEVTSTVDDNDREYLVSDTISWQLPQLLQKMFVFLTKFQILLDENKNIHVHICYNDKKNNSL